MSFFDENESLKCMGNFWKSKTRKDFVFFFSSPTFLHHIDSEKPYEITTKLISKKGMGSYLCLHYRSCTLNRVLFRYNFWVSCDSVQKPSVWQISAPNFHQAQLNIELSIFLLLNWVKIYSFFARTFRGDSSPPDWPLKKWKSSPWSLDNFKNFGISW